LDTKQEVSKKFSQQLQKIRKMKYRSQKAAARAFNIPDQTYRNYELGISLPSIYELLKIISNLEINLDYLLSTVLEKPPENSETLEIIDKIKKIKNHPKEWESLKTTIDNFIIALEKRPDMDTKERNIQRGDG